MARRAPWLCSTPGHVRQAGRRLNRVKHTGTPRAAALPQPRGHMRGAAPAWCAASGASASCRKCSAARPRRAAACQSSTAAAQPARPAARARVMRGGAPAARRHARSPAAEHLVACVSSAPVHLIQTRADGRCADQGASGARRLPFSSYEDASAHLQREAATAR